MSATEHESQVNDETADERRDDAVRTHSAEGETPFTDLEGEERRAAVRSAARRLMKENRELMDRLSER